MRLPQPPPSFDSLFTEMEARRVVDIVSSGIARLPLDEYLHWDQLRRKPPPKGFSSEEWWFAKKMARGSTRRTLPLKDKSGAEFGFSLTDNLQAMLHQIDRHASGSIDTAPEVVANPQTRDRYLISSLFEEAITSSQLEGASTAHRVAKEMLRVGRRPRDRSEQMIVNNYQAMQFVREITDEPLTIDAILELHRIVTDKTLDSDSASGRLRTNDDSVQVIDDRDNTILHEPPNADELDERIDLICRFANEKIPADGFLHPVIRAILIHFMIGYDHPFIDGNGRAARALFYWSMVRSGYWLTEFLSISTILTKAPDQYARAYLYTESDDQDMTYFVDFNLRVILKAIDALHHYLRRKAAEVRTVEQLLSTSQAQYLLNHRQVALLSHALKHPASTYTIRSHMQSHAVTYQTARVDLLKLAELGLMKQLRRGKTYIFRSVDHISDQLQAIAE